MSELSRIAAEAESATDLSWFVRALLAIGREQLSAVEHVRSLEVLQSLLAARPGELRTRLHQLTDPLATREEHRAAREAIRSALAGSPGDGEPDAGRE
jgi:hypothetical protein